LGVRDASNLLILHEVRQKPPAGLVLILMDIDLAGRMSNELDRMADFAGTVCEAVTEPEGIEFNRDSIEVSRIKEDAHYEGARVRFLRRSRRRESRCRSTLALGTLSFRRRPRSSTQRCSISRLLVRDAAVPFGVDRRVHHHLVFRKGLLGDERSRKVRIAMRPSRFAAESRVQALSGSAADGESHSPFPERVLPLSVGVAPEPNAIDE
jgi:hypothetical protein